MSSSLQKYFKKSDLNTDALVKALEQSSGYSCEDNRLAPEIMATSTYKISSLGLDSTDSTAEEVYYALAAKYQTDSQAFSRALGEKTSDSKELRLKRISTIASHIDTGTVWALKPAAIKKMMKSHPPIHLMKLLGYRSPGSMLKRENTAELFVLVEATESSRYLKNLHKAFKGMPASSFEQSMPQVMVLSPKTRPGQLKQTVLLSSHPEVGAVCLWPGKSAEPSETLSTLLLIVQAVERLHCQALSLKARQFEANFGKVLGNLEDQKNLVATDVAGMPIFWRSLRWHYGRQAPASRLQLFDGYQIDFADLHHQAGANFAAKLHPALAWWKDNGWLLWADADRKIVSFNLLDAAANYSSGVSFSKRKVAKAQDNLWDELISRYLKHAGVQELLRDQLDSVVSPNHHRKQVIDLNYSMGLPRPARTT